MHTPGRYPYTTHLLKLQQFLPSATPVSALKVSCALLQGGSSPLRPDAWARLLTSHPDKAFGTYLTDGLTNGFRIGFNRCQPLTGVTKNMPSALRQHSVVADYIRKEVTLGRMIGPLHTNVVQFVHRNRIGVVPKGHTTGKWRLITDLSFPPGYSVNDGIDPALCSLSYVSIDSVAVVVASLGAGSLLAKIDIESAYRLVYQFTPMIASSWGSSGRDRFTVTPCCLSASGHQQRYSRRSLTRWSGSFARKGYGTSNTILMILWSRLRYPNGAIRRYAAGESWNLWSACFIMPARS